MRERSSRIDLSTLGGVGAIVLWSSTIAVSRSLSEQLGPLTAGASVYLLGGVFSLLRLPRSRKPLREASRLSPKYLFGCGFLFVLYTLLLFLAVGLAKGREQVLQVGLINYLWPAMTILLSLPLLKKRASSWLLPGTALALAGVFLVMTQGASVSWRSFQAHLQSEPTAFVLALMAAVAWALYSNLTRRWSGGGSGGAVAWFIAATGCCLLALRFIVAEHTLWSRWAILEAAALAAVTALAYTLWDIAMRKGDLVLVAACSYLTPLFSTLVSCAYLRVTPDARLWAGCGLIVAGSLVSWLSIAEEMQVDPKAAVKLNRGWQRERRGEQ